MVDYPANFPLPEWLDFQTVFEAAVLRSSGAAPEQRIRASQKRAVYQARIVMTYAQLGEWMRWINANGYGFFNMPVTGPHTTENCAPLRVRIASDLAVAQAAVEGYVNVRFNMEHEG